MNIKNFEFKAKIDEIEKYENKLLTLNPDFQGLDHQIDTYFNAQYGRLKLREGNIENSLINYDREIGYEVMRLRTAIPIIFCN